MHVTDLTGFHQPLELGTSGELWVWWETAPVLHTTRNTLLKDWYGEKGEIFFSPVIVDNMSRYDAFEAEVQEKVQGFHPVLLLPAGIKTLYAEERTYTCKHLTTTSGFPVCLLFWFCFLSFFFIKIFTPLCRRKGQEQSLLKINQGKKSCIILLHPVIPVALHFSLPSLLLLTVKNGKT